ncbi:MAG: L-histidine N(alpha)-methyltransferase [Pseudomonadota bacterium]
MVIPTDLTKKDILEDLVLDPERPGVWNFYNPKNLYLTDSQGKLYLELMGDDRYTSRFHDPAEILIKNNSERLVDYFKDDSILIVDLGPGYPSKTFSIIDTLLARGKSVQYWAIDVNDHFCKIARDAIARRGVEESYAKKMLFENTAEAIRKAGIDYPKLIIIGLTFMNFDSEYILKLLADCASHKSDVCLSAIECIGDIDVERLMEGYKTNNARKFVFAPLSILGLVDNQVEYAVSFRNQRIETAFTLKRVPPKLKAHGVKDGDKIIAAISYRYTAAQYESLLKTKFEENFIDRLNNTILAISGR